MKTKLISLFFLVAIIALHSFEASSKTQLRLNLQKGSVYDMKMSSINQIEQDMMGQKIKIDQKIEMVFTYTVLDILPDKNFLIEYSFSQMKLNMNMNGQVLAMDSESPESNPMNKAIKDLLSFKLKIILTAKGQVVKIDGLEEFTKKLSVNQQMAQAMKMFTDENNFKSFFTQTFNYFPENEIAVGDQWNSIVKTPELMNAEISMIFAVTAIENNQIYLDFKSIVDMETPVEQMGMKMNVKMAGNQSGKMIINKLDGWPSAVDQIQKYDMKVKLKNPQSGEDMEIPMVTNSVTNIVCVRK